MTATAACRASRAGRGGTGGGAGGGAGGSSTGGGAGGVEEVSAGNSKAKAEFIIGLVEHFEQGKISGAAMAKASDREAAKMLMGTWGGIKGLGEWSAGSVLMHFLGRADVMLYGDLTIRNYINDLYDVSHNEASETLLESAADFGDNGPNRNRIDAVAAANGWAPYRSVGRRVLPHVPSARGQSRAPLIRQLELLAGGRGWNKRR